MALTICCCLSGTRDIFRNYDANSNGNFPEINEQTNTKILGLVSKTTSLLFTILIQLRRIVTKFSISTEGEWQGNKFYWNMLSSDVIPTLQWNERVGIIANDVFVGVAVVVLHGSFYCTAINIHNFLCVDFSRYPLVRAAYIRWFSYRLQLLHPKRNLKAGGFLGVCFKL